MLEQYRAHVADRAAQGVPPLPLDAAQVAALCDLLKPPPMGEEAFLIELLRDRIPPGVDQSAYVKDGFLTSVTHATTRPDIPLHATVMLESCQPGSLETIAELKKKGHPVAYVGDVVGTGSSRKSVINSVLWQMGEDIPFMPNKRSGGYILGSKIAPIFFNTAEDSGALPIECDISMLETGDVITVYPSPFPPTMKESFTLNEMMAAYEYIAGLEGFPATQLSLSYVDGPQSCLEPMIVKLLNINASAIHV